MGTAPAPAPTGFQPGQDIINEFTRLLTEDRDAQKQATTQLLEKGEIKGETKEKITKIETDITALSEKVTALAQKSSRPPVGLGGTGIEVRSVGQQVTEHDNFKSLATAGSRVKAGLTLKTRLVAPFEQRAINPFIGTADSGYPIQPQRRGVLLAPVTPLVMRDLMDVIPLDTNAIEYVTETFTNNADYQVAEGDKKAQSDIEYDTVSASAKTIAHFVKIARQMLADAPFLRATLDNRMVRGIAEKEDKEILYGNNAAGHLQGIMPIATAYNAGGLTVTSTIDQMYAAMVQVMSAGYAPSAVVMNPVAFAGMQLLKNDAGAYLLGNPPTDTATPRLWGLPVVQTMNVNATDFLVGAFPGNAALFDREQATVEMATENEDDFVRNLVTLRAEERILLAWFAPQAFVKGTLYVPAP